MTPRVFLSLMLVAALGVAGCAAAGAPAAATPASAAAPAAPAAPTTTAAGNGTTVNVAGAAPPPCCPHETLPQFLGIAQLEKDICGLVNCIRNELGSIFPGLEATPPILAITDPANMNSSNPAVAAAAQAKADEDAAPQKIKAIRYLATLGCAGCYPGIDDALLASLDDCTEEVRYEAAKAFRDLSGRPCTTCKTKACCSEKVRKKLTEVANKMENGCYKESSARVRRLCRLALAGCGGGPTSTTPGPQEGPSEGPTPAAGRTAMWDNPTLAPNGPLVENVAVPPSPSAARPPVAQTGFIATLPNSPAIPSGNNPLTSGNSAAPSNAPVIQTRSVLTPGCENCGTGPTTSTVVSVMTPGSVPTPATTAASSAESQPVPVAPRGDASQNSTLIIKAASASPGDAATTQNRPAPIATGNLLAEVNGQGVYESEVLPAADRALAEMGPNMPIEEKLRQRPEFIRRELVRAIDRKLICQEARQSGPGVLPASFVAADADEGAVADQWLKRMVRVDEIVSPGEMADYYRANQNQYTRPAEVRYEMVAARMDRFASRDEALAAIEFVRQRAAGVQAPPPANLNFSALDARTFGWTRRDSVGSTELADLLFRLPVGATGPALELGGAWIVVRVLERHTAGIAPLEVAADAIRQQVLRNRRDYLETAYVRQLRSHAQVWTVFDPPARAQLTNVRPLIDGDRR